MNTARITTLLGLLLVVSGCATLSYPLPKCDGYSKRPLNRSMWDWDASKTEADKQQSSLNDGSKIVLAFADQTVEPTVHTAAFAGFDEAASHTACQGG
ncbi:type IV secretion system protein VirB7 [Brucella grignonensis]|uniref:Putative type IV secretion system protein VirB7 n=1 Tax=Brucella grignonensis TaxID=94627 RepID=A0A256FS65_9HYPH|nr:type IV secretion system protein VirB7 [Brucella grignonensis]OYR17673.1 putative type IV secretion system protein VirB7 [Brucella grignonensis]